MTIVDGMPITPELAQFLKSYCPDEKDSSTFLTASIENVSNVQDFISMKLDELNDDEKKEVTNYISGLVMFKKDLIKLAKLLPTLNQQ